MIPKIPIGLYIGNLGIKTFKDIKFIIWGIGFIKLWVGGERYGVSSLYFWVSKVSKGEIINNEI